MIFSGPKGIFVRLCIRGGLLELVTLGFYRFWLTTDIRRHLWAHTSVGGDPAEYTGRARELLIGFLIAMAVLVPIYAGFFVLTLEAERIQAFASVPLGLLFYVLIQYAIYRARRYRVTRTVWRGLRFSMGGSGWGYAWRAVLWTLFAALTLGIAWPWRTAALERYMMQHTAYGSLQGEFHGKGWDLFKQVWYLPLVFPIALILVIGLPVIVAWFRAIEYRWWISNLKLGDVSFECDIDNGDLILPYIMVWVWSAVAGAVFFAVVVGGSFGIAYAGFSEEEIAILMQHPAAIAGFAGLYLLLAIATGVAMRVYLMRDFWAKIVSMTEVYNLSAADNVEGQGELASAIGEGFADGLDIGGF
ncbi:membrane protein [Terrihabitans soli]|uniref:Membrane protein n=1 Tax=Terrihabitans soli TaxID=708113 RepID=A0A6S6QWW4_9HYPH|nr:YjgN family protein [Terrihabitans soli]BCJ91028.1 membrane protein [Terrihabitans soli]